MHRRSLIIRRFGELSFGLGFVEDGVWEDHSAAVARGENILADATAADRAALDAFHAWFACCEGAVLEATEGPTLVAIAGSAISSAAR